MMKMEKKKKQKVTKILFITTFSFLFVVYSNLIEPIVYSNLFEPIEVNSMNLRKMGYEFTKIFLIMTVIIVVCEKIFKKDFFFKEDKK